MADEATFPYLKGKVVYQIYPRSFYDANGDGVGDIPGIIQKLDYLNDGTRNSLGINMIWLSPFYPSPMNDFGYDVADYCGVDPLFGTLDDFQQLVAEAHRRDITIMIDFVPNHTSHEHPWFQNSRASRASAKRDWYIWRDPKPDGSPPNNWLSVFGGSAWEYDAETKQYYMHSFLAQQPDLNWENPDLRAAMMQAMRFWLDLGVDGIRVDAVDWMAKDQQFRDNPPNLHYSPGVDDPYHAYERKYSQNAPQLYSYLREMAEVVKDYPKGFMVTETYPDRRNIVSEYLKLYDRYLAEVSAPFNFEGILLPWTAISFKTFIDRFQAGLKPNHIPIYVLGNHDNSRLVTRIGQDAARAAALMLLTLPGIAFIYYGDELGMTDVHITPEKVRDPFEKRVPGMGLGRDPERTPMQWSALPNAGFSKVKPWLPVGSNFKEVNAVQEGNDQRSILSMYRKLIQLRRLSPILQYGNYESLEINNAFVFGFARSYKGHALAVVLNFSDQEVEFNTALKEGVLMYTTHGDAEARPIHLSKHGLRPNEGQIVTLL